MKKKRTTHIAWTGNMGLVRVFFTRRSPTFRLAGLTQERRIGHGISRGENLRLRHGIRVANVGYRDMRMSGEAGEAGRRGDERRLTLDC